MTIVVVVSSVSVTTPAQVYGPFQTDAEAETFVEQWDEFTQVHGFALVRNIREPPERLTR